MSDKQKKALPSGSTGLTAAVGYYKLAPWPGAVTRRELATRKSLPDHERKDESFLCGNRLKLRIGLFTHASSEHDDADRIV
jgi:hypothetical protein